MKSLGRSLSRSLSYSELFKRLFSSRRRVNPSNDSPISTEIVPVLQLNRLEVPATSFSADIAIPSERNAAVLAEFVYGPPINVSNSANKSSNIANYSSIKLSFEHSLHYPFDHFKSQSPETADNSDLQPRYNNMIFFDPKENIDPPRDQADQRRKKFLTVISANSISPRALPSPSPGKQSVISDDDIHNTYQQSLIKMKDILIEIEKLQYSKAEITEACQYAREFKGIMNGRDGVIGELRNKYSELDEDKIEAKFERLKTISLLFQQKCFKKDIFSGRDENSLKSQYKFADGKNKRPGLRLTYIPNEAFEMYKQHSTARAVEFSAAPAAAKMGSPRQM